jgi:hypothetical protein
MPSADVRQPGIALVGRRQTAPADFSFRRILPMPGSMWQHAAFQVFLLMNPQVIGRENQTSLTGPVTSLQAKSNERDK